MQCFTGFLCPDELIELTCISQFIQNKSFQLFELDPLTLVATLAMIVPHAQNEILS